MWQAILDFVFTIVHWFYTLVGDWGLSIILITILIRILLYPITRKQFKSTYSMQKLQPKIQAINEKYANDPQRKQEETVKVYQEAKFSPLSGCLPMLLQMPVFIALYQVLRGLEGLDKIDRITGMIIEGGGANAPYTLYSILPDITKSPSAMFAVEGGLLSAIPYILMLLLFGASMAVPMLLNKTGNPKQMRIMMIVMIGFMLFIGWGAAAGVLLYWVCSSYIGVAQQFVTRYLLKKKDEREAANVIYVEPVKVDVDRKERKARPRKKS